MNGPYSPIFFCPSQFRHSSRFGFEKDPLRSFFIFRGCKLKDTLLEIKPEAWLKKIENIVADICLKQGCELYDIEVVGSGNGRVLRIFIDKPVVTLEDGSQAGVGIEDCSNVARGLNEILDVEGGEELVPGGAYSLEVSSPGLDRHLKTKNHFEKVVGKKIYVQLDQSLGSLGAQEKAIQLTKKFEEVLKGVEDDKLVFDFRQETIKVPLNLVHKAKLTFEFKENTKGKKK